MKKFSATTPIYYQADIQILRGFAILVVVLYHIGFAMPGGFVGVDMFFAISGYVITQFVIRESETPTLIFLNKFYSRRARRLLPALSVLIISTMTLSIFFMSPFGEQQEIAETARASSLFSTNFYFFFQSNYWALTNNPFRHLWSLAIEEQFYLIFPLLIILLRKLKSPLKSRRTVLIFVSLGLMSFIGSYFLSFGYRFTQLPTRFAFFGTPWRLWELIAGSLTAIVTSNVRRIYLPKLLSAIALLLIFWPLFTLNSFTPFPGTAAFAPVLGTSLLLVIGSLKQNNLSIRFLKPLEKLGDISYSWYLWHWPLIVFVKKAFPESSISAPLAAAIASAFVAQISTKYLETPIRKNDSIIGMRALTLGVACMAIPFVLTFALSTLADTGLGLRSSAISMRSNSAMTISKGCTFEDASLEVDEKCNLTRSGSKKLVLLVGDSAAASISDGVYLASKKAGLDFRVIYGNSCPFQNKPNAARKGCPEFVAFRENLIRQLKPEVLVIANMTDLYTSANPQNGIPGNTNSAGREPRNYKEARNFWIQNLEAKLRRDLASQKIVFILQPPFSQFSSPTLLNRKPDQNRTSRALSEFRDLNIQSEITLLKDFSNVTIFDPAINLCPDTMCIQFKNGSSFYHDSRHLTVAGSMYLSDGIYQSLISSIGKG